MTEKQLKRRINSFIKKGLQNLYGIEIAIKDLITDESASDFSSTEELIKYAVGKQICLYFDSLREEEDGLGADDYVTEEMVQEELEKFVWWLEGDDDLNLVWDDVVKKDRSDKLDPSKMTHVERCIADCLQSFQNFTIPSGEKAKVEELAECFAYTTIPVVLDSLEVLRGKRQIHLKDNNTGVSYSDYDYDWAEPIINHPDKQFCVLFKIGAETDRKLIMKLSSYLDAHAIGMGSDKCDNFICGLLYDGDGSNIPESIKRLCPGKIRPRIE